MDKDFTLTVTFDYGKFEYSYDTFEEARTAEREFRNQHATHFSLSTPKSRAWIESSKDATKIIDQATLAKLAKQELTKPQADALALAARNGGYVVAGYMVVGGGGYHVNARTLDALARKGFVKLCWSSEGGMAARVVN